MIARPTGARRILALVLAFATALVLAGVTLIPNALAAPDNGQLGDMPTGNGSLTIHKYDNSVQGGAGTGEELDPAPQNKPLEGVTFTVAKVNGLDLTKNADWAKVAGLKYDEATGQITSGAETFTAGAGTSQATDQNGETTFADLPIGVYLVTETNPGNNPISKKVDPFFVTVPFPNAKGDWITDVHVYPKNDVVKAGTKEVTTDKDLKKIGDQIPWTITTTASVDHPSAYGVVDQLPNYLEYAGEASVTVNGQALAAGTDFTIDQGVSPARHVTFTFTPSGLAKVTKGATVAFHLTTTVTSLPQGGVVKNAAWPIDGEYNPFGSYNPNSPNPQQAPIVPTQDPKYGQYQFKKVDAENPSKVLSGAEFVIYADQNATQELARASSNAQGVVDFPGIYLGKGDQVTQRTVYLKEVKAPTGFVLDDQVKAITLVPGAHQLSADENVVNTPQSGPALPLTGARGRLLLTLGGIAILAIAGGLAFVSYRRKNDKTPTDTPQE